MNQLNLFSYKKQTQITIHLSLCFLTLLISYASLQNFVSLLYQELGFNNLGQTAVMFIYLSCAIFTSFSSYVVRRLGYKKSMLICSFGYILFSLSGLVVVLKLAIDQIYIWIIICFGASICGMSASIIWVAQGGYISLLAGKQRKNDLIPLFWIIALLGILFSGCFNTFVLGNLNTQIYFYLLIGLFCCSSLLFMFLPDIQIANDSKKISICSSIKTIISMLCDKNNFFICLYFVLSGIIVSFYSGFLYKIIKLSLPKQQIQQKQSYQKRLRLYQGIIFISLGASQFIFGVLKKKISSSISQLKIIFITSIIVLLAGITSFVSYQLKQYYFIFVPAILWGTSQIFTQTNTNILVSTVFKGRVEGYSLQRICYTFGICFMLAINILLSKQNQQIYLIIVVSLLFVGLLVSFLLMKAVKDILKQSILAPVLNEYNKQKQQNTIQSNQNIVKK